MNIILDFVSALLKDKVSIYRGMEKNQTKFELMNDENRKSLIAKCNVPNFDLGRLMFPTHPDFLGNDVITELAHLGDVKRSELPFKNFVLTWIASDDLKKEVFNIVIWSLHEDGYPFAVRAIRYEGTLWTMFPLEISVRKEFKTVVASYISQKIEPDQQAIMVHSRLTVDATALLIGLLDKSEATTLVQASKTKFRIHNLKTNQSNVPITKILRVNQTQLTRLRTIKETIEPGSPKSGHLRRGHWRRLPNGGKRWIDDLKVKGGPVESPLFASSYKLVNDKDRVVFGD